MDKSKRSVIYRICNIKHCINTGAQVAKTAFPRAMPFATHCPGELHIRGEIAFDADLFPIRQFPYTEVMYRETVLQISRTNQQKSNICLKSAAPVSSIFLSVLSNGLQY